MKLFDVLSFCKLLFRVFLIYIVVLTATYEPFNLVDGVAGATVINVVAPDLSLTTPTGSPPIVTNGNLKSMQVNVGQTVTIDIQGSDPYGYINSVIVGVSQDAFFYYSDTNYINGQYQSIVAPTVLLPTGSQLKNKLGTTVNNYSQSQFKWTPTAAYANTSVNVQFIAGNFFYVSNKIATSPITQSETVAINVLAANDTLAPVFSVSKSQTVNAGIINNIPITVLPDSDQDSVVISSNNLPTGAVLGNAAKMPNGSWVSIMSWTPQTNQVGVQNVTFTAQDQAVLNQTTVPESPVATTVVAFTVQNQNVPEFDASMKKNVLVIQNQTFKYYVIVNPDPNTNNVSITPTNLPPGAFLNPPELVNGQLVAMLTWRPNVLELGSSYTTTFTAEDNLPNSIPVQFQVVFKVVPHFSVFKDAIKVR